ncbi:baseplate J/gp47 family protein [Orenia marismortui]|uniref:baseplate J/gp47 family protein n=1 Tax=Orenia marismortui TaxID=46469 RepID=UPI000371BFE6|nr:baseplate J/gp47 family protein [Orenia marismortui]
MEKYIKIYIDPDEPLSSFLKKIKSAKVDKVVVIVHRNSPVFVGQVNVELIKNYAKKAGKNLVFITKTKKIKKVLTKVGFEVYSKLSDFENNLGDGGIQEEERESLLTLDEYSNARKKSKKSHRNKAIMTIALSLLLIGVWIYFAFPVITVELRPTIKEKTLISQIKAVEELETVDWHNSLLPLIKNEVNLEEDMVFETTGNKKVGVDWATGVLTLINSNRKDVTIPQGTIVATRNNIRFKTSKKVVVPQAQVEKFMDMVVGVKAGQAEVDIIALNKGEYSNVSKGRIVDFVNKEYPVDIVNPEATSGGKSKSVKVVAQKDINQGLKNARKMIISKAEDKLQSRFNSDLIFFKDDIKYDNPTLQAENSLGEMTNKLRIKAKVKISGFAVEKEGLKKLIFKLYKDSLKDRFNLKTPQITIKDINIEQITDDTITFKVKSIGQVVGKINKEEIINQIVGKKVTEARKLLDNMLEVNSYEISPVNQVNLPQFKYGINLIINADGVSADRRE